MRGGADDARAQFEQSNLDNDDRATNDDDCTCPCDVLVPHNIVSPFFLRRRAVDIDLRLNVFSRSLQQQSVSRRSRLSDVV